MKTMKPSKLRKHVTDHAIVRYVERVHGIDLDEIREAILADGVYDAVCAGVSGIKKDGVEYVLADRRVVTVIAEGDQQ